VLQFRVYGKLVNFTFYQFIQRRQRVSNHRGSG